MLTWAISRAGYQLHEFAVKVPRVNEWIEGKRKPTVKQLESFSKKVYLPFGYLFLPHPPKEEFPIPFFRTNNKNNAIDINVYDTILLLQQRQEWLTNYLKDNEFDPLPFVGKYHKNQNVKSIVNDIRKTLRLSENWAAPYNTWQEALNHLIEKIEDNGIITVFNGVVENNTHRKIAVDSCRGFVLVDERAPFMFINNADAKAAQMFTVVHELAHIWTGQSAGFDLREMLPAADAVEKLCDTVAAELLVPEKSFLRLWNKNPGIKFLSRYFKVSQIVIARRALDTGRINKREFFAFYNDYIGKEYKPKSTGGDFYATTKKRLSVTFASHINTAVKSGQLLYRDAYKLTGLKGGTFQAFFAKNF